MLSMISSPGAEYHERVVSYAFSIGSTASWNSDCARIARARPKSPEEMASRNVSETHYPKTQTFLEAISSGDFGLARAIVAQSLFHDAIAPIENAYETTRSWYSAPELAVDPTVVR